LIPLYAIVSALLFACSAYAVILAVYTSRKIRNHGGGLPLFLLMAASAVYSAGYALELCSGDPEWTFACLRVQYLGLAFMPYLILRISVGFTCQSRLCRKLALIPLAIGIVSFLAIQTNPLHGLFYPSIGTDASGPFPTSLLGKGPLYAFHMTSFIVSCLAAFLLYARRVYASRGMEKQRLIVLASTSVFPLISIVLYLTKVVPWNIDPSPVSALICCNLMVYGIRKTGLLELGRLARDLVFSSMHEGVIVTSKPDIVADYNGSVVKLFPEFARDVRGKRLSDVIPYYLAFLPEEGDSADYRPGSPSGDAPGPDSAAVGIPDRRKGRSGVARVKRAPAASLSRESCYEVKNIPVLNGKSQILGNAFIFRDVTREREYLESLKKRALIDGVTELYNRIYWDELASQALQASLEAGAKCAFLMFDLDNFKAVNDSYGHEFGDRILRSVSKRVLATLREHDLAGRYGGDEFCVCLPNTGREESISFSERLRREISCISASFGNVIKPVTISIGISVASGQSRMNVSRYLAQADQALYSAKRNGRDRVEFFGEE